MGKVTIKIDRGFLEAVILGLTGLVALVMSTSSMLPVVMQDEYVYRRQTVLFAPENFDFPTYLFSLFALMAESNSEDYYFFIKLQNSIAAAIATTIIYWSFNSLANRTTGILGAGFFLVVPAIFQSSFYMPDMFLSSFLASSLALLIYSTKKNLSWRHPSWWVASIFLAAALFSKPHALFFVAGLVLFSFLNYLRTRKLSTALMVSAAALFTRLVLGFIWAGPAGLNLLGNAYSQSLVGSPERIGASSLSASGLVATSAPGNPFVGFLWEFIQLLGALSFFSLGLFALVLFVSVRYREELLLSSIVVTSLVAIAGFEVFVGLGGDDHSGRILTRHIEYLVAFVVVAGLLHAKKLRSMKKFDLYLALALVAIATLSGSLLLGLLPSHRVSDGAIVILSGTWGGGLLIAITAFVGIFWFTQASHSAWPSTLSVLAILAVSVSAFGEIRTTYSTRTAVDAFATAVAKTGVLEDREVTVIGDSKAAAELFLFYTLPASANIRYLEPGTTVDMEPLEDPRSIFVPLGEISLVTRCSPVPVQDFVYYDCSNLR